MFRNLVKYTPSLRLQASGIAFRAPASQNLVRYYSEEAKKEEPKDEEPKDEVTLLKEQVEASKKEVSDFKDRYLRSVADFRNLQESTKREIQKSKDLALKKFAKDLLETADTFEIALKTLQEEDHSSTEKKVAEVKELVEGVELTQKLFLNTLKRHGLEKMEPIGEKFDPNVHEATFEVPQPDKEAGTVFFVQQPGYFLNQRVLRPAKVGVVKGSE
ncbi:hypothetical protein WICMUC_001926 [Wickerhamomyces mucosus]|uniref:GrpE protein homolog, mitochondrial n=1 Tax=Wickerhamomyces mucosus TaxID=1378264 RepID=A0A9P8PSU1_9ASCO|nr:hypothetical protein WICMUC_001926 [Wickerhamomyces mucosus]